jgi:hypothetical protein
MNTFLITLGTVLVTLVVTSTAGYVLARTCFPGRCILAFYGPGRPHGYAREYSRAYSSAAALDDPLALHLADNATLRELYLNAEGEEPGAQVGRGPRAGMSPAEPHRCTLLPTAYPG